jgi:ABC-type multidrug transport system ATPase subunit
MPAIEVEQLTKRYGERRALDRVDLAVDEGECLALLGPNGAGKSTLVDVLATIRSPSEGRARVLGHDVRDAADEIRRRVGVAFQQPITHDHLSARELVLHQARLYGMDRARARERADELLAFVSLADRADDRIKTFSEGMKRRADLARVLVTEPDVLLLDEPAAGLDPRGRRAIRQRLRELARSGTTLVVATHQMRDLGALADRVAVLHEGTVRALDEPRALQDELGEHVLRVELAADSAEPATRLAELGIDDVRRSGPVLEAVLDADDPTPSRIWDELAELEAAIDEVAVREPDLGDVFLAVVGRALDDGEGGGDQ